MIALANGTLMARRSCCTQVATHRQNGCLAGSRRTLTWRSCSIEHTAGMGLGILFLARPGPYVSTARSFIAVFLRPFLTLSDPKTLAWIDVI